MFCTTCGRQIINEARFCNFCGAPVRAQAIPAQQPAAPAQPASTWFDTPASAPISEPSDVPMPEAENASAPDGLGETRDASDAALLSPDSAEVTDGAAEIPYRAENARQDQNAFYSAAAPVYPMPGEIPQSGGDPSANYTAPEQGGSAFAAPEKPKPERRYTLAHIILCLSSTAVMAIMAGIFAGLYFSVV